MGLKASVHLQKHSPKGFVIMWTKGNTGFKEHST